jgi:uncharacterized membrane protein
MTNQIETALQRWTGAGLLALDQADRIREYEAREPAPRARLPVVIGLALGGILFAAGLILFVSAHWEQISPAERMTVLILAVAGTHLTGALTARGFPATSATMHALGTAALGAAIFLGGQIFNMREHWPTGVMLWAIGALAGWLLLRQWPQLAVAAILIPWWLVGEWTERTSGAAEVSAVSAAAVLLLAICYLSVASAFVYAWLGGIALLPAAIVLALSHAAWGNRGSAHAASGLALALAGPLAFSFLHRGWRVWVDAVAALWVLGLYALAGADVHAATYAWCALGCIGLIAWGVYELGPSRVNLGMAGFALTVICFFFSDVMGKLDRSFSLLILGTLFLGGGWYWEKVRRQLVVQSQGGVA